MSVIEIRSEAFERAALKSERIRVIGLLWALAALMVVAAVRARVFGAPGELQLLVSMIGLAVVMTAYEALMLRFINRSIAAERLAPAWVWYANIFVETLFPTAALLLLAESGYMRPYQALVAPAGLFYFLFIILSTLRLSPDLSRLTGLLAAVGYMSATGYVYWQFPGLRLVDDFTFPIFATYGAFILIGGFVAGEVATQIRTHVAAALREADTRREKEKLERDLNIARSIQQGLLPSEPPAVEGFDIAGWNQPADQTGGDYYDWQKLSDGRVVVILADVTGHGIGPALVTAACRAYGRATLPIGPDLGAAMSQINQLLVDDLPPGKLVTFVTGLVDPSKRRVELLSAGHGPLVVYTASDRRIQSFEAHAVPFGFAPGITYGPPQDIAMAPGDMVVLMTDGFFEWENSDEEEFGMERLEGTIRSSADLPPDQIIAQMYRAVTDFAGGTPQVDDLTVVIIKRTPQT